MLTSWADSAWYKIPGPKHCQLGRALAFQEGQVTSTAPVSVSVPRRTRGSSMGIQYHAIQNFVRDSLPIPKPKPPC